MTAATDTAYDPTKRNVFVLAICQALAMSSMSLLITISAIVGQNLAPTPSQATLPLAIQFLGMVCSTLPASMAMRRWGRRTGFTIGATIGAIGGALATTAPPVSAGAPPRMNQPPAAPTTKSVIAAAIAAQAGTPRGRGAVAATGP